MSEVAGVASRRQRLNRIRAAATAAALLAAAAGWFGWLWYTTPLPPAISLDGRGACRRPGD